MAAAILILVCMGAGDAMAQEAQADRTELPINGPWYPPITTLDARDAKAPPLFQVEAPKGAPNVVVILLDDLGFGGTGAIGSVIPTPRFDKLASQGLLYNQFHTTALCSPTRQALKTGRNARSITGGPKGRISKTRPPISTKLTSGSGASLTTLPRRRPLPARGPCASS